METETVEILPIQVAANLAGQDITKKYESGLSVIDSSIDGGFREGDFTIISGIPGDGKTTFCRSLTMNLAKNGTPTLWLSYEMTVRELWDSFEKMGADAGLISYVPFQLEDDYNWIIRHIDKAREEFAVKAVFIDTLGDVVRSEKNQKDLGNYATYLAQLCKDLRQYAVKHEIMIFAVAHATKNTRSNTNETDNADIANSNGIPAAATNIFHVWRDKEDETLSYVKVGKSRRDGSKKGYKFRFRFTDHKLMPEVTDNGERWKPIADEFPK
jgi:KaiC/GvpD/RAD55 family RecA-like ATPase